MLGSTLASIIPLRPFTKAFIKSNIYVLQVILVSPPAKNHHPQKDP